MYKVVSKTRLIQTVTIVNDRGNLVAACIPPRGFVLSRVITNSIQHAIDNGYVVVKQTPSSISSSNISRFSNSMVNESSSDSASVGENISITEISNSENIEESKDNTSEDTSEDISEDISEDVEENVEEIEEEKETAKEIEESADNDLASMTKSQIVEYAKSVYNLDLDVSWKKSDLISEVEKARSSESNQELTAIDNIEEESSENDVVVSDSEVQEVNE